MSIKEITGSRSIDYALLSLYLSLVGIGWLMIYAVGYGQGYMQEFGDWLVKTPVGKQTIFIGISALLMFFIMSLDWKFWRTFSYGVYGFGLILLCLVLVIGVKVNGARAWFGFGGFGFQPAEIAKLGTCLALSSFLATPTTDLRETRSQLTLGAILLLPIALIMLQPDVGSCLVFFSFSIMLYREGLSPIPFIVGFLAAIVFIFSLMLEANIVVLGLMTLATSIFVFNIADFKNWWIGFTLAFLAVVCYFFTKGQEQTALLMLLGMVVFYIIVHSRRGRFKMVILTAISLLVACTMVYVTSFVFNNVLQRHQQDRINVWLRPDKCDPRGVAYNLLHSKMAIGSGGLQGKGFLEGTMTKLSFVPEQSTDFIFCTIGEEQGFIGVFGLLALFMLFLIRIIQIAERQKSNFSRHYAYGVAGIFFIHFLVNVGMTMGLLPVIGIPLPFISAGGSSLLGFTTMFAILLKLDSHRYDV